MALIAGIPATAGDADQRFAELKQHRALPSPRGAALEVVRLSQRDDATLADLARVVQADPALAGRLIQLANAAGQGAGRPLFALPEVLARLGFTTVRNVALGFSLLDEHRKGGCRAFDYERYWSHALATAIAAQQCARHLKTLAPDEAFAVGLLANIGQLALASVYPEAYGQLIDETRLLDPQALLERESRAFALDHAEVSAALLADWGFPAAVQEAVLVYGSPQRYQAVQESRNASLARMLKLATTLASMCVLDDSGRARCLTQLYRHGASLSLDQVQLAGLLETIVPLWRQWGTLLTVAAGEVPSLERVEGMRRDLPPVAPSGEGSAPGLRVLLVDDDQSVRQLLASWLHNAGHDVRIANNGDAALQEVLRDPPQVVITDWEMPVMDGLRFCRALRETVGGRQIYVMMVTGHGDERRLQEAFQAGADDFIAKPVRESELVARLCAGRRFIEVHQGSLRDSAALREIADELVVANRRLRYLARTDELTGLPNRRHAMERLEQEFERSRNGTSALGMMIVDIDHFKAINDNFGHLHGDAILKAVAKALRSHGRTEDFVGRVGGEEFMVLAPGIDSAGLVTLAERVRAAVARIRRGSDRSEQVVTVSVGCSLRRPDDGHVHEIIRRCDQALYRAKGAGRNCVELA